ncbi:MAG: S46 family peptidase [Chitinophagaceae bacterium]|nr:S46 family peptidase [Chitinophagaceae bacterium]
MKFRLLFLFLFLSLTSAIAKEGMWLPFLLEKMNEKEMKSMGLKITAKDIYDINAGSLKDAIVIFGGGCTGEVISDQGLVLTNHHCGYGTVQGLSSVQNNYLLNGFFAKNNQEEIPCPGLSVTFIVRIDDVTAAVKQGTNANMPDTTRNRIVMTNIAEIEKKMAKETGYETLVKSFYYENEYYLFLMEKYTDIRLVAFPPNGIGKFGGDTDNWAWPRHTGDFGVFRIYANGENKPATYAKDNQPYHPRRSLAVNIGGVKENDFTMVYGFPGRTSEYLTSDGVAEIMEILDPARIRIRETRLSIMEASMKASQENFIRYAAKQAGIANYYKKWKGELLGLKINDAINKKKKEEAAFTSWVNGNTERISKYGNLLAQMKALYAKQADAVKLNEYINEAIWSSDVIKKAAMYPLMMKAADTLSNLDSLVVYARDMKGFYKSIDLNTDREISTALFKLYEEGIGRNTHTDAAHLNWTYDHSFLSSPERFAQLVALRNKEDLKGVIQIDPAYVTWHYFDSLQKSNLVFLKSNAMALNRLYGQYILALQEYHAGKQFYPDANSTLRLTYGKVEGVKPQDGMRYTHITTLDGAVRKHNPNAEEFTLPAKMLDLYAKKDYGQYAVEIDGVKTVPIAFLASNHTTGGNSGSPVLNAKGELIGTNFDRIWEGTMSDILFDPNLCRNITLDVRYTLFVIDKFGGAGWLLNEMKLVK